MIAQTRFLRVLQERKVERIGGTKPIPIDIRIVAATNRNLEEMVSNHTFRQGFILSPECHPYGNAASAGAGKTTLLFWHSIFSAITTARSTKTSMDLIMSLRCC